ncbi:hypothetical protein L7F22_035535 [Adiantum nelumboides]|nr:hypothetical protein [Adiantum nelumboides]
MKPCCSAFSSRYELLRVLGKGAQGIFFTRKDRATGCFATCKTCRAHAYGLTKGHAKILVAKTSQALQLALASAVGLSHEKRMTNLLALAAGVSIFAAQQDNMDLRHEILLLSMLQHHNILAVESSFECEDGFVHLVTPSCAKGTLYQFVLKLGHIKGGDLYNVPKPLVHDYEVATVVASLANALIFCPF